jgi:hypothetical protein
MIGQSRTIFATGLALAAGFAVWASLAYASGRVIDGAFAFREPWDTSAYATIGLPVFALAAAVAGYIAPSRVWRWAALIVVGQAIGMAVVRPPGSDLGLIPVTLIFIGVPLVVALTIPGAIGAAAARRRWDRAILV